MALGYEQKLHEILAEASFAARDVSQKHFGELMFV